MIPKEPPHPYQPMEHWNSADPVQQERLKMLEKENAALRKAGAHLAMRAMFVIAEYDGLHRLALAVSEWAKVMADEHGRGYQAKATEESCDESK